jgi:multiple sugar transport system permease protein
MTASLLHRAPAAPAPRPRTRRRGLPSTTLAALGVLTPFMAVYILFVLWPVVEAVRISLYDWDLLGFTREVIGADNYERMLWGTGITWNLTNLLLPRALLLLAGALVLLPDLRRRRRPSTGTLAIVATTVVLAALLGVHPGPDGRWNDPTFWTSVQHTVEFTLYSTPLLVGLGLLMALGLAKERRGNAFYRTAFFLPYILPVSAVTLIWSFMLNPDRGLVARWTAPLGLEPISWLSNPDLAMWGIIITTVWWAVGFNLVLFLAGLQDIDPSLYEAASLDGAGRWAAFRHITLPGLKQVSILVVITQLIASFQVFGQVYIMTRGGPGTSTRVVIQHIYEAGFRDGALGYAAAVSLFLFVVMALVSAVQFQLLSKED